MRKTIFAAAAAVLAANAASAADFPRGSYSQRPVASPIYNWSGAYAGLNLGYQWGETTNNPTRPAGIAGGGQIGYNWQNGAFVFGGETDIQISGADDTFAPWKFANPWFGTLRGRAGYAISNVLFYGTGGLAFGELTGQTFGLSESHTTAGWTAGVGAEVGFAPHWSAKIEYLYVDLSSSQFVTVTNASNGYRFGTFRAGVNYHF